MVTGTLSQMVNIIYCYSSASEGKGRREEPQRTQNQEWYIRTVLMKMFDFCEHRLKKLYSASVPVKEGNWLSVLTSIFSEDIEAI